MRSSIKKSLLLSCLIVIVNSSYAQVDAVRHFSQSLNKEMRYAITFPDTYTAVGLIGKMKVNGVHMIIDCGTEDFLLNTNRQMHQLLLEAEVPHDYIERPGSHNWEYWTNALPYHFLFFHEILRN